MDIILDLGGTFEYEMGNYQGHLCFEDSDKLKTLLMKKGIHYSSLKITRTTSEARPLLKTAKILERKNNK
ncbi:hypothetical protein [Spiroplasma taiwanense]|uniref:Uncharacterized protein n=1 Tax=Spiroplasma taiwanense CT-1 TaxID=1276220 RepID=S5LW56_9MOLU|nr:hypothetical protein [Spiroplasma taiwanense]AGR40831.1 hypothetical protein STAIW_v1c01450 [Spiroplasma taiwanense CT-1]